jgi:hypothetical protein
LEVGGDDAHAMVATTTAKTIPADTPQAADTIPLERFIMRLPSSLRVAH